MADNTRAKAVDNAKRAKAEQPSGAGRRATRALEKAHARAKKAQHNVDTANSRLDAALMALEKTDVGSPEARKIERAARAALKELLAQRRKLRRAHKARRRAEAKGQKAHERRPAAAAKDARPKMPAAQPPVQAKKRPAKRTKRQSAARAKNAATKANADTPPVAQPDRKVEPRGLQESAGVAQQDSE